MKIFITCIKTNSIHSVFYKFMYLLQKLLVAKDYHNSSNGGNNSTSISGSDISNYNNKDYLIKLKTLKDTTIHLLNNKINELTDEVNFKESLQIKIINSTLSFFENDNYLSIFGGGNNRDDHDDDDDDDVNNNDDDVIHVYILEYTQLVLAFVNLWQ